MNLLRAITINVLILSSQPLSAQCINPFSWNKDKFDSFELEYSLSDKSDILKYAYKVKLDYMDDSTYYSQFHPIYIDSDSLVDIIFEGQMGGESLEVDVLLNTGSGFESIISHMGQVLSIERVSPNSGLIIYFEQYGCCDDPANYIQTWILSEGPYETTNILTSKKTFYLNETIIPECFDLNQKFEVANQPYSLRATPEIINELNVIHNYDRGNIIAEYGTRDTGTALASRSDNTGRVWWFVVMDKPKHYDLFHNYSYYRNEQWAGWMSSRYLKLRR